MCGFTQRDVLAIGVICHTVIHSFAENVGNYTMIVYRENDLGYQKQFAISELKSVLRAVTTETENSGNIKECGLDVRIPVCLSKIVVEKVKHHVSRNLNTTGYGTDEIKLHILVNELFQLNSTEGRTLAVTEGNFTRKPRSLEVWCFGFMSVGVISLSGLFGGVFLPLRKTKYFSSLMRILLGLAVGSLTATSTLQLIPEGFQLIECTDNYLNTSVCMLGSIWILYLFDVFSKILFSSKDKNVGEISSNPEERSLTEVTVNDSHNISNEIFPVIRSGSKSSLNNTSMKISPLAMMILFGDGLHNFIDGMSIGAGFSKSLSTGFSMSIAIACEEFPHELGDFAILISTGMPVKKALLLNFLSACSIYGGLVLGILLGELQINFIFAFAGGLFLYVSLTEILPELNEMINEDLKLNRKTALKTLFLQSIGIAIGVSILYIVTKNPVIIS